MSCDESNSDSDYDVEAHIKPERIRSVVNDESADLLGNFDDQKRKQIEDGTYEEKESIRSSSESESSSDEEKHSEEQRETNGLKSNEERRASDKSGDGDNEDTDSEQTNGNLTKQQLAGLLRGASKANRFVVYVTNLNFETTKEDLVGHFSSVSTVKSVRIPKKRRGGFAFVELTDIKGFRNAFKLHNTELQGRQIKVQISEAGRKKSANKKNIIKQKNRKLAEMRNEQKTFTKSGKFYDKDLKQEKAKEMLARKRWRKKPAGKPAGL